MQIIETIEAVRRWRSSLSGSLGYVASLGGMHSGHATLMQHSRSENDRTVVSIFVNPIQFGKSEDFAKYPRELDADVALCKRNGVDAIFAPSADELLPAGLSTTIRVNHFRGTLCDPLRPQLFDGVCTIVHKFLNLLQPTRSYFGKKDFQQLRFVQQMVVDLNHSGMIIPVETVREPDGLASSTRNRYMSVDERASAPLVYRA